MWFGTIFARVKFLLYLGTVSEEGDTLLFVLVFFNRSDTPSRCNTESGGSGIIGTPTVLVREGSQITMCAPLTPCPTNLPRGHVGSGREQGCDNDSVGPISY